MEYVTCPGNQQYTDMDKCLIRNFNLSYNYYPTDSQHDGIYTMFPTSETPLPFSQLKEAFYFDGYNVKLLYIIREKLITKIALYPNHYEKGIVIETQLNTLSTLEDNGKAVTLNILCNEIDSYLVFQTDSNGLEMQPRALNYRK